MSHRVVGRLLAVACACAFVLIPAATALADNAGDVWIDNVGQPAGPGHEMDPHLACQDINLWGSGLADSSGAYTIDGWPPSGSQEQDYASTWSYDQSTGGSQVLDVISVKTLIENAIANGDAPQNGQGFHFKLEFSQDPQKHKTFWVNCQIPTIATTASSNTAGGAVRDTAVLNGGDSPTGSITWNVYEAGSGCTTPVFTTTATPVAVDGDGTYYSPYFTPSSAGIYQWVATYSGDDSNLAVSTRCDDPAEQSIVSKASPTISTTATSNTVGGPVHDQAVLNGGDSPTGWITWDVYMAGSGCTTPVSTTGPVKVSGDNLYNSPDFTPSSVGTYQWVATYSGDANNNAVSTECDDPSEQSVVQAAPAPGISLVKLERDGASGPYVPGPIAGNVGDTIDYQMTVTNIGNTSLVITFSDPRCDAGTLSAPALLSGTFDPATNTLSPNGELQYTCRHVLLVTDAPSFTNTAVVSGQPPSGSPVSATSSVVATLNLPGITVVKLQRDGSSGAFTTGTITAKVGDTIEYEIEATNTGNTPLALSFSDPLCSAGTIKGPFPISGTLSGNVLSPGGVAEYTCSHVLTASDQSPFTNTARVTGQPPSGPPVQGTARVTANKQAIQPITILRCTAGKVKKHRKVHGKTITVCVAKRTVSAVVRRRIPTPRFTG